MLDMTLVNSEAFVLLLAKQGHLDSSGGKKKKQVTTNAEVEEFINLVVQLQQDRKDQVKGREWDEAMMEMAKQLKEQEEKEAKEQLDARRKK